MGTDNRKHREFMHWAMLFSSILLAALVSVCVVLAADPGPWATVGIVLGSIAAFEAIAVFVVWVDLR